MNKKRECLNMTKNLSKMKNGKFLLMTMFLAACMLASCGRTDDKPAVSGLSKMICDESFQNIMDDEIEVFEYQYPKSHVLSRYMGESAAFDSLMDGTVDLIITYRELTSQQREYLKSKSRAYRCRKIAIDGLAIIVNNENDIDELTMNDLKDIFTGASQRWGQVYPTKLKNDSILIIFDGNGTGALHYIQDKFNDGKQLSVKYFAQGSTEDVFKAVESHKNALGIVGVSWLSPNLDAVATTIDQRVEALSQNTPPPENTFTDRIKVMKIREDDKLEAYKPYQAYLYDGSYPLFRIIYAIDASPVGSPYHDFFAFLTGVIGQKIILQTGIVPASVPIRMVELQ